MATADDIAYYDGAKWRPVGSDGAGNGPLSQHPAALGITLGNVYVGGAFTSAGGDSLAEHLAAYALRLPDALVGGTSAGPFAGNNVYSSTGAGEVREVTINRGTSKDVYVKIQNDGLVHASFTVTGTGSSTGITAHYFAGTNNITAAVSAGTYPASIDARASIVLRLHIVVANSSAGGATLRTTVRSQSGTPPDAVRVAVTAR